MRKLATIRKIDALTPILGADAIECAIVGGWTCVVKKGEYTVGDLAVYLEIDSWVPTELAPFLSKGKEPRAFEGIKGERLRTVKLRGQLSQGLLLPMSILIVDYDIVPGEICISSNYMPDSASGLCSKDLVGADVSELLGIIKWEMPMNAQLAGMARGNFPSVIPKTDQERVQNLKGILTIVEDGLEFEVTEKLEGSSMTVYLIDGVFGVCSRNLDLKETEDNTFWQVARLNGIEEKLRSLDMDNVAIQGELIGPGIQGNIYKLSKPEFWVFDIYNIKMGEYVTPAARRRYVDQLGLLHVPVMAASADLHDTLGLKNVKDILKWAEGPSAITTSQEREGIVFKQVHGGMTFKAISNKYLLGEK
jgi:RNA ligase (TIGR02306 family)